MTAALVRSAAASSANTSSTVAATLAGGAITAGNTLLAVVTIRSNGTVTTPAGWTYRGSATVGTSGSGTDPSFLYEKVAVGGESLTLTFSKSGAVYAHLVFMEYSGAGAFLSFSANNHLYDGTLAQTSPTAAATDPATLALAGFVADHAFLYPYHGPPNITWTPTSGYTVVTQAQFLHTIFEPALAVMYKAVGAGSQVATTTVTDHVYYGSWLALYGTGGTPEPAPDPPEEPHEDEPPQGVLLEIKVAGAGTARWGSAHWGVNVWSSAAWTDVTPEGVRIFASWGADRAEDGILARTRADTWNIDTYDPDRLMDPGNPDATWAANLVPGLPVRFSHRGVVIRYGVVESIGYDYANESGYLRVTNAISYMANAKVPTASVLPDTLRARARSAIAAAGLSVTVEPDPSGGDPAVASQITDESSVWDHVQDAAQQVLHIPFMDHNDVLRFRAYAAPLDRGVDLSAPELVNLLAIRDAFGQFSTVRAFDGATIIERSATPTPRYGNKVYDARDAAETINAADWALAVLEDRSQSGLRWVPGVVRPLTANSVERFARIEACELVGITHAYTTPGVSVAGIVLGGEVTIIGKVNEEAVWSFAFRTSETAPIVLVEDMDGFTFLSSDQDPTQFLLLG